MELEVRIIFAGGFDMGRCWHKGEWGRWKHRTSNSMVKITQQLGSWIVSSTDSKLQALLSSPRLHRPALGRQLVWEEQLPCQFLRWCSFPSSKGVHSGMRASTSCLQLCSWGGHCFPASGSPSSRSPHHWTFQGCSWVPQRLTHHLPQYVTPQEHLSPAY